MTPDPGIKPIGIITAMPSEARALGVSGPFNELIKLDSNALVYVCGIGSANARRATTVLLEAGVSGVVSWGTAGGLTAELETRAVIISPTVVCADAAYETDTEWATRIGDMLAKTLSVHRQPIYSGGLLVNGTADKLRLAEETGAIAVDMESGVIAETAVTAGTPFICIRVVADPVSFTLPSTLGAAIDDAGFVSIPQALRALARQPGEIVATLQTAGHFRQATQVLSVIFSILGPRLLRP